MIVARELSLAEIARIRRATEMPLEVFVHGALCVAYSGQCLTSEALGGRSANRGECAQACRMPYQIVCDGRLVDLDNVQYLLSPQDLAAYDLIPELIELGIARLKIEGRLKTAEYVANITRHYRMAIDAAWAGEPVAFTRATCGRCSSRSRAASHTGSSMATTTRSWCAAITPRSEGSCSESVESTHRLGRAANGDGTRSSRATAWSSTATKRPAAKSKGDVSMR